MIDLNQSEPLFFIANLYQPLMRQLQNFCLKKLGLAPDLRILIPCLLLTTRNLPRRPFNVIAHIVTLLIMICYIVLIKSASTVKASTRSLSTVGKSCQVKMKWPRKLCRVKELCRGMLLPSRSFWCWVKSHPTYCNLPLSNGKTTPGHGEVNQPTIKGHVGTHVQQCRDEPYDQSQMDTCKRAVRNAEVNQLTIYHETRVFCTIFGTPV